MDGFFEEIGENNIKNIIVDLRNNGGGNSVVTEYFAAYIKNLDLENLKGQYSKVEVRAGDKVITFSSKFDFDDSIGQGLADSLRKNSYLFDGKIYIATSNITFSSAMNFATFFSDNNLATIVGEVPGNSPTCFGDNSPTFKTPNSQISFNTTYKKFYRTDPTKDPDRLIPDVQVEAKNAITRIYELMKN